MKTLSDLFKSQNLKGSNERTSKFDGGFDFLELIAKWPSIVGERLSAYTCPLKNQYQSLTVLTNHSAFSQQLNLMEKILIEKIEKEIPGLKNKIKRINFIFNERHFNQTKERFEKLTNKKSHAIENATPVKKKLHKFSPEYKQIKIEAEKKFSDFDDLELKDQLVSIYIQMKEEKL